MPWSESRVDDRMRFIAARKSGRWSMDELCRSFGISRKTAYKFLSRFQAEGRSGLADRSRARRSQGERTPPQIERRIVEAARRWGCWGPRKIVAILRRRSPEIAWPAKSTVSDILKRHGLVKARKPRPRVLAVPASPLAPAREPNDVWAADFKGWCLSGKRERLEPFVLGDLFSRYGLACKLVDSTAFDAVWPIFERVFREYGLPRRFRSDNGPPFATAGLASLSRLTILCLRLGIRPERIEPGKPQQNGMLERMNGTVGFETMNPPAHTRQEQERNLQRFRMRFNHVRPHEALGDRTPADVYRPSSRKFSGEIPEFQYQEHIVVRQVHSRGTVKWAGTEFFLSDALIGEPVGFEQFSSRHWAIRLGPIEVAIYDDETGDVLSHRGLVFADDPEEN